MRVAPDYPHQPKRGSLDVARMFAGGGLLPLATHHQSGPLRLWHSLTLLLYGFVAGVGSIAVVVSAMVGRP